MAKRPTIPMAARAMRIPTMLASFDNGPHFELSVMLVCPPSGPENRHEASEIGTGLEPGEHLGERADAVGRKDETGAFRELRLERRGGQRVCGVPGHLSRADAERAAVGEADGDAGPHVALELAGDVGV